MKQNLPIAVQLYSLRELPDSFDEMLAKVADAGYTAVETLHDHGLSAEEMLETLNRHNLRAVATHVQLAALQENLDAVIAFHKQIGNSHLILPVPPQAVRQSKDAEAWRQLGRTLNELGARCLDADMQLGYHSHAFEMAVLDGKRAIDWLLGNAELKNLFWEPDLAWIAHGGADPVALLERYAGRCPRVHVKDLAPAGENTDQMGLADVGHGTLDWETILPAAKRAGAEWYIVEHDKPKDPITSVRRSLEFLQSKAELL